MIYAGRLSSTLGASIRGSRQFALGALALGALALGSSPAVLAQGDDQFCYPIADHDSANGNSSGDDLVRVNKITGLVEQIGPITTVALPGSPVPSVSIEATAWDYTVPELYAIEDPSSGTGQLGFLTLVPDTNGNIVFNAAPNTFGTCDIVGGGTFALNDVDAMSLDPLTGRMWAVARDSTNSDDDLLFEINIDQSSPNFGAHVPSVFGGNDDCLPIQSTHADGSDIDDLAIEPNGRWLVTETNSPGSPAQALLNELTLGVNGLPTGAVTNLGNFTPFNDTVANGGNATGEAVLQDVEGMSFGVSGIMYASTGNDSGVDAEENHFWLVDLDGISAGTVPTVRISSLAIVDPLQGLDVDGGGTFDANATLADFESLGCLSGRFRYEIGDTVFIDIDRDGIFDIGEPGIPDTTVLLYFDGDFDGSITIAGAPLCSVDDTVDCLADTTATDTNGEYLFVGNRPGTYLTTVVETTLPDAGAFLSIAPGNINPSVTVTAVGDQTVFRDLDFGYVQTDDTLAFIGDLVWYDPNGNGLRDPGDLGIAGVNLALLQAGPDGVFGTGDDVTVDTTTTFTNGTYYFYNVTPGVYQVNVTDSNDITNVGNGGTALAGFEMPACAMTDTCVSGQDDPSNAISVLGDDHYLEADFPYLDPAPPNANLFDLRDRAYVDLDNDGIQDPGEPGLRNVTVALVLDNDSDGVWDFSTDSVIATDITDANGDFDFTDVPSDGTTDYLLVITDINGETIIYDPTTAAATAGQRVVTNLNADDPADPNRPVNFGYNRPGLIGDTVWTDVNQNGLLDDGEPRLGGVQVELFIDDGTTPGQLDGSDKFYGSYITNSDGSYQFTELLANPYIVSIDTTQAALTGYSTSAGTPDEDGTAAGDQQLVTLINTGSGTSSDLTKDFGYLNPALFDISGTVFQDQDRDGFFDVADEAGFEGVTVILVNSDGDSVATTTVTGGAYTFLQVPDGDYTVVVTDDLEVLQGYELTSGLDEISVTMAGADITDVDFGYARDPLTGSIGDRVWLDANADGLLNGSESGLGGVNVELWDVGQDGQIGGGDDTLLTTTITGPSGRYLFPNLGPGDYFVRFPDANASGVGTSGVLGTLGLGRTDGSNNTSTVINLFEGQEYDLADSGWRPLSSQLIGDLVFYDANDDGLQQLGEVGQAGVDVLISGPGITFGPGAVTQTNASGRYFYSLPTIASATDYLVTVCTALTSSSFPGGTCNGINPSLNQVTTSFRPAGVPPGDNPEDFTVTPNVDRLDADYGFNGPGLASIGDTVFLDRDGNGTQDGIDPGIEGVTVALVIDANNNGVFDPGEVIRAVDITDGNGVYDFQGVDPTLNWLVAVTDQNNVLRELNQSTPSGLGGSGDVPALVPNQDYNLADFGFAPRDRGTIGNQFWRDLTTLPGGGPGTLGLFEAGEPGIPDVSIKLWLDNNGNGGNPEPGTDNCVRGCVDLLLSDQNGQYEFRGLPPGDYIVEVTDELGALAGLTRSVCAPADCPDQTADDVSKLPPYSTTLTVGSPFDFRGDFGYEPDPGLGSFQLTGLVYFDAQPNGDHSVQNPLQDFAVDGVLVRLFQDNDFDGVPDSVNPFATQITSSASDATVNYTFTDLPPGGWVIEVDGTGTVIKGGDQTEPPTSMGTPANRRTTSTCSNTASLAACQASGENRTEQDFGFHKPPTLVLITNLRSYDDRGTAVVEFSTASEIGPAGFYVWRQDPESGEFSQVNASIVPADRGPRGATYRVLDPGAAPGVNTYVIYEVENRGAERVYGPFEVELDERGGPDVDEDISVLPRPVSAAEIARLSVSRAEAQAAMTAAFDHDAAHFAGIQSENGAATQLVPARVQVRKTGMQRLSSSAIATAMSTTVERVERWIANGNLRLVSGQRQVSWAPTAQSDGIVFYGTATDDATSGFEAYRLRRGVGRAMNLVEGGAAAPAPGGSFTADLTLEEQVFAGTVVADDPEGDFWFWKSLNGGHPSQGVFSQTLEVPGAVGAASLTVHLYGASGGFGAVDHRVTVRINGVDLGMLEWAGLGKRSFDLNVPSGVLTAGANQFELVSELAAGVPFAFEYVDRFELSYERSFTAAADRIAFVANASTVSIDGFSSPAIEVYDITSPTAPKRVVNTTIDSANGFRVSFVPSSPSARYVALTAGAEHVAVADRWSDWQLPEDGAEYLVVAPRQMLGAAQRLAEHRELGGLSTLVVELEALQAEFADGRNTPRALQTFFERAWERWTTKPRFAVLLGKGSFDYRDHLGLGGNLVPPLMTSTTSGLYASDLAFADVVGDDDRPEFAVGRIPALTSSEAHAYVDKLISYEQAGAAPGANRVLLVSDDTDTAGGFSWSNNGLATRLGSHEAVFIDMDQLTLDEARSALQQQLDSGSFWVNYFGHGGLDRFAHEGLFTTEDVDNLSNGAGLPIVSSLTCSVGRYEVPGLQSLAEALTLASDRGAIAVFAPSGTSFHPQAEKLGALLFDEAFGGAASLGEAIVGAMRAFDGPTEALRVYQLMGDPAIAID